MIIKKLISTILNKLGYNVKKITTFNPIENRILATLKYFNVDILLDVGANSGQYAQKMREAGYEKKIISFEPLSDAHKELEKNAKKDEKWLVAPRCAIGEINKNTKINVSENSVSSSLNEIMDSHLNAAPESKYIKQEEIEVKKIDDFENVYFENNDNIFLKIDAQGYDFEVLKGAEKSLKFIRGIQIETSFEKLYENQKLFLDINKYLENLNYKIWAILPGFSNSKTGQMLQADIIFVKK